jgi:hypothetical protein
VRQGPALGNPEYAEFVAEQDALLKVLIVTAVFLDGGDALLS